MKKGFLCIDIGGTKTACAIYEESGREAVYHRFPTQPERGPEDLIDRIYDCIREDLADWTILGGGLASPGPLDIPNGKIAYIATMGWRNVPIVSLLEERFGISFCLLNDCDAGALGVANYPAFLNYSSLAYVSLSTGIGGGFVHDGEVYSGAGNAADFGHIPVHGEGLVCGCGRTDCLELYASGSGLERRYLQKTGEALDCLGIEKKARAGDPLCLELFADARHHLSYAMNCIRAIIDPAIIVFGGSVCRSGELILGDIGVHHVIGFAPDDGKQVLFGAFAQAKKNYLKKQK